MLILQTNLANTYLALGRTEDALRLRRDVYSGSLQLKGEEDETTLLAANNYAAGLVGLHRYAGAGSLLRRTMPVARRVLGESNETTLRVRWNYARTLYEDAGATLDDLREAETTLEDTARIARRVLGCRHPTTAGIEMDLQKARETRDAHSPPAA